MLKETGRVIAVDAEGLWVETITRSTCGSCAARSGCGQSMLARIGGRPGYLWVSLRGRNDRDYHVGDDVTLGVPEDVVAQGSLLVYLLPLITLVAATVAAHHLIGHEGLTILAGALGLVAGGIWVRWRAHQTRHDSRLQPVLLDETTPVQFS